MPEAATLRILSKELQTIIFNNAIKWHSAVLCLLQGNSFNYLTVAFYDLQSTPRACFAQQLFKRPFALGDTDIIAIWEPENMAYLAYCFIYRNEFYVMDRGKNYL